MSPPSKKIGENRKISGICWPPLIGVVVDEEVALFEVFDRHPFQAGGKSLGDRAQLDGGKFRLRDHFATRIHDRGGTVLRFPHDRRMRAANEFCPHFMGRGDESAIDNCVVDFGQRHWISPPGAR